MHLVGFIIRIYHDARSPECQKYCCVWRIQIYLILFSVLCWVVLSVRLVCLFVRVASLFSLLFVWLLSVTFLSNKSSQLRHQHSVSEKINFWNRSWKQNDRPNKFYLSPSTAWTRRGTRFIVPSTLTSALDRGEWSTSHPRHFTPENKPDTHWRGDCVGPRTGLDVLKNGNSNPTSPGP